MVTLDQKSTDKLLSLYCLNCDKQFSYNGFINFCSESCEEKWDEGFGGEGELAFEGPALVNWRQYALLQKSFQGILDYVEPTPALFLVYSPRLLEFLRNVGGEVDSVCHQILIAKKFSSKKQKPTMEDYRECLQGKYCLSDATILVPQFRETLRPFGYFAINQAPPWWKAYIDLKHNRAIAYPEANLRNALESLGALYLLNIITLQPVFDKLEKLSDRTPPPYTGGLYTNLLSFFHPRGRNIETTWHGKLHESGLLRIRIKKPTRS